MHTGSMRTKAHCSHGTSWSAARMACVPLLVLLLPWLCAASAATHLDELALFVAQHTALIVTVCPELPLNLPVGQKVT